MKAFFKSVIPVLVLALSSAVHGNTFTVPRTQVQVVIAPGFDHVPVAVPVTLGEGTALENLQITSDKAWAVPSLSPSAGGISVQMNTKSLPASSTATLKISSGATTVEVFLTAEVNPLNVYRLLDDPFRPVMYGIHLDGSNAGAVFSYDPTTGTNGFCVTVGKRPTDFVISDDGSELLVICSADKAISVIDLATFTLKETIPLPVYGTWGSPTDTTANIDLGPGNIIYYTDGSWGPIMRVFNRSTRQVIQSLMLDGTAPSNTTGFMDFAVTSDRTKIVAMPQYGWSAGGHDASIAHYAITTNGMVSFIAKSTVNTGLLREPFEAPALITGNDQSVFLKTIAVSTQDINDIQKFFPSAVWAISPGGEWVSTSSAIYDFTTGNQLVSIPNPGTPPAGYTDRIAQAFSSDYTRFVYFNPTTRTLNALNLLTAIGPGPSDLTSLPAPDSVVSSVPKLSWAAQLGVSQFNVYFGTSAETVSAATPASPEFLGTVSGTQYTFGVPPAAGATYFWRVDPIISNVPRQALVLSFILSPVSVDVTSLKVRTVSGVGVVRQTINLAASAAGQPWSAAADRPWISFDETTGTAPGGLGVLVDTSQLAPGVHLGAITLTTALGSLTIPVELDLLPMNLTLIKSDPLSAKVYAVSENNTVPGAKAYLLEIDSQTERITRAIEVGASVTDIALHQADNRIYITNWQTGALLAVDLTTFSVSRTYPFRPFGSVGYGEDDVFRVAAGKPGRLVVEEYDQWIEISIYNTVSGTKLGEAFVREGGGAFDSTGRYYYHGENNSSGAAIRRFDVTGDAFTLLASVRPPDVSYYGSRTVVVSENDQRVFWANVAFDALLNPEWTVGEPIYSCTRDGRFAFAESKIYDVNRRLHVLGMPAATKVSAFNSTTSKLVTQGPSGLAFHSMALPLSLPAPTLLSPAWSGTDLIVAWNEHSLETAFHLQYRLAGSADWTDFSATLPRNSSSTAVWGLDANATYEFRLRAVAPEVSSPWSEILLINLALLPPPTPNLTSASALSPYLVSLNWTLDGTNSAVRVERSEAGGGWSELAVLPAAARAYSDTSVQPETTYAYRTVSLKGATASAASNEREVSTPELTAPSAPEFTSINALSPYQVSLAWADGPVEESYRIERKLAEEEAWQTVATLPKNTVVFLDGTVTPNMAYLYRVFAVNALGTSPASIALDITTPALLTPTAPLNLVAQPVSATAVALSWSDALNETSYRIERSIGEGPWQVAATLPADTVSHTDPGLTNGMYYYYRVVAVNQTSETLSSEVNVVAALTGAILADDFDPNLDAGVWSSVAGGEATAGPTGFFSANALHFGSAGTRAASTRPVDLRAGGNIVFQFRAGNQAVDGNGYWNNSEEGENVVLEYSTSGGVQWEIITFLATQFPNHNNWTHYSIAVPSAARGEATQFRWRQLSNSGASFDTWALDEIEVRRVLPPPPDAPESVVATATGAKAVDVTWPASPQASSYIVERSTAYDDWAQVGATPFHQTSFIDSSVGPATEYAYRVLAFNSGGPSEPSEPAFVTTWSILEEWRSHNYGTTGSTGVAADLEDNGTGIPNILRYAFNMSKDDACLVLDPLTGNKGLPCFQVEANGLEMIFLRRRDATQAGIRYIVEFSGDLKVWFNVGQQVIAEPIDEDFELVVWRDAETIAQGQRFGRVRVERIEYVAPGAPGGGTLQISGGVVWWPPIEDPLQIGGGLLWGTPIGGTLQTGIGFTLPGTWLGFGLLPGQSFAIPF